MLGKLLWIKLVNDKVIVSLIPDCRNPFLSLTNLTFLPLPFLCQMATTFVEIFQRKSSTKSDEKNVEYSKKSGAANSFGNQMQQQQHHHRHELVDDDVGHETLDNAVRLRAGD